MCIPFYILHLCMCTYTLCNSKWRRKILLCLMMSETAAHTCAWIICLKARGLTHRNISIHTYKQYIHLHMHTHPFTFTTHTYCCIQILLFFYSCFSHKTYYLFVPLYSHVIFKCFIIICNSPLLHFWHSALSCEQELNKCSLSFGSWRHLAQLLSWYFPWILFFRFVILVRSLNITIASDCCIL